MLLVFGLMALVGIWITGIFIDRWLRMLVLISLAGFALISLVLGLWSEHVAVVFGSVALWGLTFGGAATLLQTALAQAAGGRVWISLCRLIRPCGISLLPLVD